MSTGGLEHLNYLNGHPVEKTRICSSFLTAFSVPGRRRCWPWKEGWQRRRRPSVTGRDTSYSLWSERELSFKLVLIVYMYLLAYIHGDHSSWFKPPIDIKTKVPIQYESKVQKRNFCFGVNGRLGTTWMITLYSILKLWGTTIGEMCRRGRDLCCGCCCCHDVKA